MHAGYEFPAGYCKGNCTRYFQSANKNKLVSSDKISWSICFLGSLDKKEVSPALDLIWYELTVALQDDHGER